MFKPHKILLDLYLKKNLFEDTTIQKCFFSATMH